MKRIRLNQPTVLFNAAALAEQLTTQMPSQDLADLDKAYFAHMLGLHAILSALREPGRWLAAHAGKIGREPEDLVRLLGCRAGENIGVFDSVMHPEEIVSAKLQTLNQQIYEICHGGIRLYDGQTSRPMQQRIYAYVLMRHNSRGFQHYARRLKLVIPANLCAAIDELDSLLRKVHRPRPESSEPSTDIAFFNGPRSRVRD